MDWKALQFFSIFWRENSDELTNTSYIFCAKIQLIWETLKIFLAPKIQMVWKALQFFSLFLRENSNNMTNPSKIFAQKFKLFKKHFKSYYYFGAKIQLIWQTLKIFLVPTSQVYAMIQLVFFFVFSLQKWLTELSELLQHLDFT